VTNGLENRSYNERYCGNLYVSLDMILQRSLNILLQTTYTFGLQMKIFNYPTHVQGSSLWPCILVSSLVELRKPSWYSYFRTKMVSSGMLRRVALVRTDVSEGLKASFIRVTRIGELGTTLAVTSNRRTLQRNTKNLVFLRSVRR
jgi:hypothetical protein